MLEKRDGNWLIMQMHFSHSFEDAREMAKKALQDKKPWGSRLQVCALRASPSAQPQWAWSRQPRAITINLEFMHCRSGERLRNIARFTID